MSIGSASPQRRWGPSAAAVLALILAVMLPGGPGEAAESEERCMPIKDIISLIPERT